MDPVGPWSAYAASYNRLAGATGGFQSGSAGGAGDFVTSHHHLAAATGNSGLGSHQPGGGVPSTTSQLLLQAAHTTASLAGQLGMSAAGPGTTASPFNPGGFLSPPPVGYDAVFSPLFHHANPKPAHYPSTLNVSQHRQALAQAQAAATKQSSVESELSTLRENYSTAHHQSLAAASSGPFFEHQASSSSPSSSLAWSHQGNTQLPSPFGILPHETVVTSSPGPATSKSGTSAYENTFNAHFAAAQSLNHLNSQLTAAAEYNKSSGNYGDNSSKKASRAQSPLVTPVKPVASAASNVPASGTPFFHQASSSTSFTGSESLSSRGDCSSLSGNFSNNNKSQQQQQQQQQQQISSGSEFSSGSKSFGSSSSNSLHHQQQSCIVSTASSTSASSKDYRIPQPPSRSATSSLFLNSASSSSRSSSQAPEKQSSRNQNFVPPTSKASAHHTVQTKAQAKIYPELASSSEHSRRSESTLESSQSSPISFAMMDASAHRQGLNYSGSTATGGSCSSNSGSTSKMASNQQRSNTGSNLQQSQFQHVMNQQAAAAAASSSYHARHYSGSVSGGDSSEYHHGSRSKASASAEPTYSERLLSSSNSSSSQNGPDCGVVVPRRPSPLQAHSQASPLGHVPSPAYPMYNSPMASMSSPSPLQQHSESAGNQCPSGGGPRHSNPPSQQQQQVAPPSPLDVTVPRPSSQGGQVAYPSVITRALTSGEGGNKSYGGEGRSFERSQQQQQQQQQEFSQKQGCWDTGDSRQPPHHSRTTNKFQTSSGYGASGMEMTQQVPAQQQAQQRAALGISERQQAYFDSSPGHQVTLQDLSSCRGDPMSIVKNLQTLQQQQTCQLQPNTEQPKSAPEERLQSNKSGGSSSGSSSSGKRRKSSEKGHTGTPALNDIPGPTMAEYFTGRVPPPAHHNTNQQQQNGGYFDFERWNLPPPPPKMFGGGPGAFGSQSPLHHGGNFVGNPAHQHQSLMVPHPHHHPPPPLPYFPAFQLHPGHHPHHPSHEFQPSVEIAPLPYENPPPGNNSFATGQETRDDQPKVIVPNIEEELGFLAESGAVPAPATPAVTNPSSSTVAAPMETKMPEKKPLPSTNPSSGFMASYMKFLQGERDSSPPPANRGGRKATWSRAKVYQPEPPKLTATSASGTSTTTTTTTTTTTATESVPTVTSNGNSAPTTPTSSVEKPKEVTSTKSKEVSNRVYDPQDDPRYFPLPKSDAKRKSFADSDGDFDSSDGEREREKPVEKEKTKPKEKEKEKEEPAPIKTPKTKSKPGPKPKVLAPPTTAQAELTAGKTTEKSEKTEKVKKGRPKSGGVHGTNKRKHDQEEGNARTKSRVKQIRPENVDPEVLPPRRETSRRKAKEKSSMKQLLDRHENLDEEFDADEPEFVDSDSDPAWTPAAKDSSDEDGAGRRRLSRRSRPLVGRKKSRLLSASNSAGGGNEEDGCSSSESVDTSVQPPPSKKHHANHRSGGTGTSKSGSVSGSGTGTGGAKTGNSGSGNGNSKSTGPGGTKSGGNGDTGKTKTSGGRGRPRTSSITTPNPTSAAQHITASEETTPSGNSGGDPGDAIPFKSGEFVVMKSDLGEEYPPIWRIDGKTLLQKYEPFDQNGKTLYRNISTSPRAHRRQGLSSPAHDAEKKRYSGWTPQNRHIYQQVPVKFRVQNRLETIVEFMRDEIPLDDQELIERSMKETAKYQDNFEVYIQTLISQALDSNFLTEIFQEQDDYFLSNVKTVDDVTEERKRRLLAVAQWKSGLQTSVGTWPCFNVISDLPADEKQDKLCAACDKSQVSRRVQMYGQPYNSTTLEGCQPDPKVANQKDFLLCNICVRQVELYNKVAHQKYLMYIECAKRVAEKRSSDPYKDTTIILNELLADEAWLNQLFRSVRTSWAEIDKMEQRSLEKGK